MLSNGNSTDNTDLGTAPPGPGVEDGTEWAVNAASPRTEPGPCGDCGVFVSDWAAHTRFHSILSAHAWTLAVLKTSHISARIHDQYDAVERIDSRQFDSGFEGGWPGR